MIWLLSLSLWAAQSAYAAACCSGGSSLPALITSDEQAQIGLTLTAEKTVGDVTAEGRAIFRGRGDDEWNQVSLLSGATLLSDRLQLGGSLPFARRMHRYGVVADASDLGLGDARALLAFEALPEWSYSRWRPKVFTYLSSTIPLGRSIYSAQEPYAVDAHGRGFYSTALGAVAIKTWGDWGVQASIELSRVFGRSFTLAEDGSITHVGSTWGGVGSLGGNYSIGDWTIGTSVGVATEAAKTVEIESLGATRTSASRVWTWGLSLSYLLSRDWLVRAAYNDQTLLGPAQNTALLRSGSLSVSMLFAR